MFLFGYGCIACDWLIPCLWTEDVYCDLLVVVVPDCLQLTNWGVDLRHNARWWLTHELVADLVATQRAPCAVEQITKSSAVTFGCVQMDGGVMVCAGAASQSGSG